MISQPLHPTRATVAEHEPQMVESVGVVRGFLETLSSRGLLRFSRNKKVTSHILSLEA